MATALETGRPTSLTPGIDSASLRVLLAATAELTDEVREVLRVEGAWEPTHSPASSGALMSAGGHRLFLPVWVRPMARGQWVRVTVAVDDSREGAR
jgi:hypothetical protein